MKKILGIVAVVAVAVAVVVTVAVTRELSNSSIKPANQERLREGSHELLMRFRSMGQLSDVDGAIGIAVRESDVAWHKGEYNLAVEWLRNVVTIDPSDVDTFSQIAWLEWSMSKDTNRGMEERKRHAAAAISALRDAVAANPHSAEAYFNLGNHFFTIGKYRMAEKWFAEAYTLGTDEVGQKLYAHCLAKERKFGKALSVWKAMGNNDVVTHNRDKIATIVANRSLMQRLGDSIHGCILLVTG